MASKGGNKSMAHGGHGAVKAAIQKGGKQMGGSRRGPSAPNMGGSPMAKGGKKGGVC